MTMPTTPHQPSGELPPVTPIRSHIVDDNGFADALDRMVAKTVPGILTRYEDDTLVLPIPPDLGITLTSEEVIPIMAHK